MEGAAGRQPWAAQLKQRIRRRYSELGSEHARVPGARQRMLDAGYPPALVDRLPAEVIAAWRGCGDPLEGLRLAGVRLAVDIGCGAGIDAGRLASQLEAGGAVLALDMTLPLLCLLQRANAGPIRPTSQVWSVAGDRETLPLASAIADLVIANATFNLAIDRAAAFSEAWRILKPGGRLSARDLVRKGELPREILEDPLADVTSLGGTPTEDALHAELTDAGFRNIQIRGHRPFACVSSVAIDAVKPG